MGKGTCQTCKTYKENATFFAVNGRIIVGCEDCQRSNNSGSQENKPKTQINYINGQIVCVPIGSGENASKPSIGNGSNKPFPILPTNY